MKTYTSYIKSELSYTLLDNFGIDNYNNFNYPTVIDEKQLVSDFVTSGNGEKFLIAVEKNGRIIVCLYNLEGDYDFGYDYDEDEKIQIHDCSNNITVSAYIDYSGNNIFLVEDGSTFIHYQYDYPHYNPVKNISGLNFQSELYLLGNVIRGISNTNIFTYDFSNNEQNYDVSGLLSQHSISDASGLLFSRDSSNNLIFVTQPNFHRNNKIHIIYRDIRLDILSNFENDYSGNENIQITHIDLNQNILGLILSDYSGYEHVFLYEINFDGTNLSLEKVFNRVVDTSGSFIHIRNDSKLFVLYDEIKNMSYEEKEVIYNPSIFEYRIESTISEQYRDEVEQALQKWSTVILDSPKIIDKAKTLPTEIQRPIGDFSGNPIGFNYANRGIIHLTFNNRLEEENCQFSIVNVYNPVDIKISFAAISEEIHLLLTGLLSCHESMITLNTGKISDMKNKVYEDGKSELYYTLLQKIGYSLGVLNIARFFAYEDSENEIPLLNTIHHYYRLPNSKAIKYYNEIFNSNYIEGSQTESKNWTLIPIENDISDNLYPEEGYKIINENVTSDFFREISGNKYPGLGNIELLTPVTEQESKTFNPVLSKITLGFLEDIGFKVDYLKADRFPEHSVYFNGFNTITNNINDTIETLEVFTYDQILFYNNFPPSISAIELGTISTQSIAINREGNRIVIGCPEVDNYGRVYIYDLDNREWNLNVELSGNENGDGFGNAVAINDQGNRIVVGAKFSDSKKGKVYVYDINDVNEVLNINEISGINSNDYFGYSLAMNGTGDIIIVGTPWINSSKGAVFVFEYYNEQWSKTYDISDNNILGLGYSVAVNREGNRIVAGCLKIAKIFDYSNDSSNDSSWILTKTINDLSTNNVVYVDINDSGDIIIVGSAYSVKQQGIVQVWRLVETSWNQLGQDISGNLGGILSVKTNGAGDKIAIGYETNQINVYRFVGNNQLEQINNIVSQRNNLKVGRSLVMMNKGNVIAFGHEHNNESDGQPLYIDFKLYHYVAEIFEQLIIDDEFVNIYTNKPTLKTFETNGTYSVSMIDSHFSWNIIVKDQFIYEYNETNKTAKIISMIQIKRNDYDIYIPPITVSGESVEYKVNEISGNVFKNILSHDCVVYGTDNLVRIGHSTFKDCSGLKAFLNCRYVEEISGESFFGCTNLKTFGNGYFPILSSSEPIFDNNFELSGFFPYVDISGLFKSGIGFTVNTEETFMSTHIDSIMQSTEINKLFTISGEIMDIIDRICERYVLAKSVLIFDIINIVAEKFIGKKSNNEDTLPFFVVNIQEYDIDNQEIPDYVRYIYIDISGQTEFTMLEGECLYNINNNDIKINEELEISGNKVYLNDKIHDKEIDYSKYWCIDTTFIGVITKEHYFYIEHGFNGYQYFSTLYYKGIEETINLISFEVKFQVLLSNGDLQAIDFHDSDLKDMFDYFVSIEDDIVTVKYVVIGTFVLEKNSLIDLIVYRLPIVLKEIRNIEYTLSYSLEIFYMDIEKIRIGSENTDLNTQNSTTIYAGRTYYFEYSDIKNFKIVNKLTYENSGIYGLNTLKYTYDISKAYIGDFQLVFQHDFLTGENDSTIITFDLNEKYMSILYRSGVDEFEKLYHSLYFNNINDNEGNTKISGFILELNTRNFSVVQSYSDNYDTILNQELRINYSTLNESNSNILKYDFNQNKIIFYLDSPIFFRDLNMMFQFIRIYSDEDLAISKIQQMTYFDDNKSETNPYHFIDNYLINSNYRLIEMNVVEGWNLIGFTSNGLLQLNDDIVIKNTYYEYINDNQNLKLLKLNTTGLLNVDSQKGYFVKCKKEGVLNSYLDINTNVIFNLQLKRKWNLIGTSYDGVLHKNDQIIDTIKTYENGNLIENITTLKATHGYFIKSVEETSILFSKEVVNK